MINQRTLIILAAVPVAIGAVGVQADEKTDYQGSFQSLQLSEEFYAEGATYGEINGDGHRDLIAGPYWFEGPDFESRHEYYEPNPFDVSGYSDNFMAFTCDINDSGREDILIIGFPGQEARWYENPGSDGFDGPWPEHTIAEKVDNESPTFTDLTGDGRPEVVCSLNGRFGYYRPDWDNPSEPWTFTPISPEQSTGNHFTHGLGVGDVNGDGRLDLLDRYGWWEQPDSLEGDPEWEHHPADFNDEVGGAQMYAYDVNGNGRNDVITSLDAHGWGMAWFENVEDEDGGITFVRHDIMTDSPDDNPYGVAVGNPHAVELVDMNGDGVKDFVVGRRVSGSREASELFWFELRRDDEGAVEYVPHRIHAEYGSGTQVVAGDISGNGANDVVVANKHGIFVHFQEDD